VATAAPRAAAPAVVPTPTAPPEAAKPAATPRQRTRAKRKPAVQGPRLVLDLLRKRKPSAAKRPAAKKPVLSLLKPKPRPRATPTPRASAGEDLDVLGVLGD
jgi:hypothetical protein